MKKNKNKVFGMVLSFEEKTKLLNALPVDMFRPDLIKLRSAYLFLCERAKIKPSIIYFDWSLVDGNIQGITKTEEIRILKFFKRRKIKSIGINPLTYNLLKTIIHEFSHQICFLRFGFHSHDENFENIFLEIEEKYKTDIQKILS